MGFQVWSHGGHPTSPLQERLHRPHSLGHRFQILAEGGKPPFFVGVLKEKNREHPELSRYFDIYFHIDIFSQWEPFLDACYLYATGFLWITGCCRNSAMSCLLSSSGHGEVPDRGPLHFPHAFQKGQLFLTRVDLSIILDLS